MKNIILRHRFLDQCIYVDQIPHKSLGSHRNVFSNKPYLVEHHNADKMLTLLIILWSILLKQNPKLQSLFNKLSYFIGVSIGSFHTISLGTKTPIFLP